MRIELASDPDQDMARSTSTSDPDQESIYLMGSETLASNMGTETLLRILNSL